MWAAPGAAGWIGWAVWAMLITGAILATAGLWRSGERLWHWKKVRALTEGDIVSGEKALSPGQDVALSAGSGDGLTTAQPAQILDLARRTMRLRLDGETVVPSDAGQAGERPAWLRLGAMVSVAVTGDTALYRFDTRVRDMRVEDESCVLTLDRPFWLVRVQRRQHFRVSLNLPASFELTSRSHVGQASLRPVHGPLHGTLRDLSAGGLCADLDCACSPHRAAEIIETFTPDTLLQVRLPIPTLSDTPLLVRILTCRRVIVRNGLGVRISCVFLPMPGWEQERLVQQIFEAQREHLRARFGPRQARPA